MMQRHSARGCLDDDRRVSCGVELRTLIRSIERSYAGRPAGHGLLSVVAGRRVALNGSVDGCSGHVEEFGKFSGRVGASVMHLHQVTLLRT